MQKMQWLIKLMRDKSKEQNKQLGKLLRQARKDVGMTQTLAAANLIRIRPSSHGSNRDHSRQRSLKWNILRRPTASSWRTVGPESRSKRAISAPAVTHSVRQQSQTTAQLFCKNDAKKETVAAQNDLYEVGNEIDIVLHIPRRIADRHRAGHAQPAARCAFLRCGHVEQVLRDRCSRPNLTGLISVTGCISGNRRS